MAQANLDLDIIRGVDFGGVLITCKDSLGAAIPLAGWSAFAEVRRTSSSDVILDLAPVIAADDSAGLVTIPAIGWAATAVLPKGEYLWDLILEDHNGIRYEPTVGGAFGIDRIITQP